LRLYLSSYRLGNRPQRLVDLVAATVPSPRVLVIGNACDLLAEADRKPRIERELSALADLGFRPEELDLRRHFSHAGTGGTGVTGGVGDNDREGRDKDALRAVLASAVLVWARGGNAFVLLRAMRQSGFDRALADALAADAIVYGGYSGGIAVLAPTLRGIETVNDPKAIPPDYQPATPWEGLGLVPYSLAPHYQSSHPASPGIDGVVRHFKTHAMPFRTLRDGEAMVVNGDREEIVA
jgi:dipeptidase E